MYTLDIIVSKEDVKIIKEQFNEFLEESQGFSIIIRSDSDIECPTELSDVIKKLFFHFLMTIHYGQFKGVN